MFNFIPETVRKNPWVQSFFFLVVTASIFSFIIWIRDILFPFFLAFLIAYMLDPLVDWIEDNLGLSRTSSIILLLGILTLLVLGFTYYLSTQIVEFAIEFGEIAQNPPDVRSWIQDVLPESLMEYLQVSLQQFQPQTIFENILQFLQANVSGIANTLSQGSIYIWLFATQTFGAVGILINVTVVVISAIYLLRDFDRLIINTRTIIPYSYRQSVENIVIEIDDLMRAFFRGHLIVSVTIGVLYGTGYQLVGLNGGFLIGFLSGLMNIIPYLGPTIGCGVALVMALYQFQSLWIFAVLAVFVAVQSLEGNILTPNIVGEAVGLNPVIIIFSLMVFGKILGFLGLLLAIPLAAISKVLLVRLFSQFRKSEYYGSESPVDDSE